MAVIDRFYVNGYEAQNFPKHAYERVAFKIAIGVTCVGGAVAIVSLISLLGQTQTIAACFAFLPKDVTYILLISSSVVTTVGAGYAITGCVRRKTIFKNYDAPTSLQCVETATTKVGKTYKGKGNLDLSYADADLGFGCIVDGVGHKNRLMRKALKAHFDAFINKYSKALGKAEFVSLNDIYTFFDSQISRLENQFCDEENPLNNQNLIENVEKKTYKPKPFRKSLLYAVPAETKEICERWDGHLAKPDEIISDENTFSNLALRPGMSFAQVIHKENKLFLFTAQARATMIIIENEDGSIVETQAKTAFGVGHYVKKDLLAKRAIKLYDITGAKRVIGLSSGISEFLTWEELQEIVTTQSDSDYLLTDFKQKITSTIREENMEDTKAANGNPLRIYVADDPETHDDLGLFVLDLNHLESLL